MELLVPQEYEFSLTQSRSHLSPQTWLHLELTEAVCQVPSYVTGAEDTMDKMGQSLPRDRS